MLASCGGFPQHELTLTFDDTGRRVTIAAATSLPNAKEARDRPRVDRLREDLVAGRDEWSLRFTNANPDHDRVLFERHSGELTRVEHVATIDAADLQKFFFDLPISATVTNGPGWTELAVYPGSSTRATRQQREEVEQKLRSYAERAVRYFGNVRAMYAYLDEKPQRAAEMFGVLFREDNDPRPALLTGVEVDLVMGVRRSLEALMDAEDQSGATLERQADLVFNPFPAKIVVRIPTEPLLVEGFTREEKGALVIMTTGLLDAVASLEGKWISPDPLAFALRSDAKALEEQSVVLAAQPRRAEAVIGAVEVANALREKLQPAPRYRVRFITRAEAPSP